jgi:predicted permease
MTRFDEHVFGWLIRLYPRAFRERYEDELLAFFRHDRRHPKYGDGPLRPLRFWTATIRDLVRAALGQRRTIARDAVLTEPPPGPRSRRVRQDLRFAWRGLWAAPGVTLSALLVLMLGIGAGTSVFSVVDAVALRGLPFARPHELVSIAETDLPSNRPSVMAPQNYFEWAARQDAFSAIAARTGSQPYVPPDSGKSFATARVTASLFDVLEVAPARGRPLTASDERQGAAPVAVISDRLWRGYFGGDPGVVGRVVESKSGPFQVVGIMPPGFMYPITSTAATAVDVWFPITRTAGLTIRTNARIYSYAVVGRLKPGVTLQSANTEMARLRDETARQFPDWFTDRGVLVRSMQDAIVNASVRSWMLMLLGAVGVVVLMACLNAANLLVARSIVRAPELAVRTALGATRWDLARSLLIESALLSAIGTAAGIVAAIWGVEVLRNSLPANVPRVASIGLDLRVLTIAALSAMTTCIAFGTIPALQASRPDVAAVLGSAGRALGASRGGQRLRSGLVIAEVTLAIVALSASGLFLASFLRVTSVDLGFEPARVLSFFGGVMSSSDLQPATTAEKQQAAISGQSLARDAAARARAVPGVVSVAEMQGGLPLAGSYVTVTVQPGDKSSGPFTGPDEPTVRSVGPAYLDVMQGQLLRGRWISDTDTAGSPPVVVVNETAAERYFAGRDPLGQTLLMEDYARTVVGVVKTMRWKGPESDAEPETFVPFAQTAHTSAQLIVRTSQDPSIVAPAIQAALGDVMPRESVGEPTLLSQRYAALLEQRRFNMIVLTIFGVVAVAIAAIGIYGLMAFVVAQRRREIGVRVALGAAPSGILSLILGRAMRTIAAGLVPGIIAAVLLERTARSFLFQARPHDPAVYGAVAAVFVLAGLIAAMGPARRATRVDPLAALRQT